MTLAFLDQHWRKIAAAAALAVAFGLGYLAHRPPPAPAVSLKKDAHATDDKETQKDTTKNAGPSIRIERDFAPNPCGAPAHAAIETRIKRSIPLPPGVPPALVPEFDDHGDMLVREVIISTGPSSTVTKAATEEHAESDQHMTLTLTPPVPRPGWEVQIGIEGGLSLSNARLAVRRRLFGDLWIEVSAEPMQRQLGAAVALAF